MTLTLFRWFDSPEEGRDFVVVSEFSSNRTFFLNDVLLLLLLLGNVEDEEVGLNVVDEDGRVNLVESVLKLINLIDFCQYYSSKYETCFFKYI